ncbi:hypothetical protein LCGC14_1106780 [marine sediment metagenome]|uniref:Restriction alleviation protein, Lar family n=1 Tax=marine sediment metagenome TaxID=412755 RepID=A0A0F9MVU0_9ZZZZ
MDLLPCKLCGQTIIQTHTFPYKGGTKYIRSCDPCGLRVESWDEEAWNKVMAAAPPIELEVEVERIHRHGLIEGFKQGYVVGSYPREPSPEEVKANVENFVKRIMKS